MAGLLRYRYAIFLALTFLTPFLRFNSFFVTQADRDQALQLATALHQRMASGDIDGIYNDADSNIKERVPLARHEALFSGIAQRLGSPEDCEIGLTEVRYLFFTKQIRTRCTTHFSDDETRVETLAWSKSDDQYRLYQYYINGTH